MSYNNSIDIYEEDVVIFIYAATIYLNLKIYTYLWHTIIP